MIRTTTLVVALAVLATLASPAFSQVSPGDRQYFSQWQPQQGSDQYLKLHYFKVDPDEGRYTANYVVWNPEHPNHAFYYNRDGKFWCAARRDVYDRWYVFPEPVERISHAILPNLQEPPAIPGTEGTPYEAPLEYPDFDGLPGKPQASG